MEMEPKMEMEMETEMETEMEIGREWKQEGNGCFVDVPLCLCICECALENELYFLQVCIKNGFKEPFDLSKLHKYA